MADIEVDLHKGLEADGWPRGPWRMKLRFDKNNKKQTIKLTTNITGKEAINAEVEIRVKK